MPEVYDPQTWANGPAGLTPISAARLTHIEDGLEALDDGLVAEAAARAAADQLSVQQPAGVSVNVNAADPRTTAALYLADGLGALSFYVNWSDYETVDNVFNTTLEDTVRTYLQHAIDNSYRLTLRIRAGSLSPAHLYTTLGVRRVFTIETDQGTAAVYSTPDPADTVYRNRYERMMTRWAALLDETYAGKQYWQAIVMVPIAGPCTVGTEMSVGLGPTTDATLHATTTTTTADIAGSTTALPLTATAAALLSAGWTTGANALLKLGSGTFARRRFWDDCTRSPVPSSGWGWNRLGHLWTVNGSASNFVATGTALKMLIPGGSPAVTRRAHIFPTDTKLKDADADYLGKFSYAAVNTVGTQQVGIEFRVQDATIADCYRCRVTRSAAGVTGIELYRIVAGTATQVAVNNVAGPAIAAATDYYLRLQVVNSGGNVTIKAKVWDASGAEPTTWIQWATIATDTYTDTTPGVLVNAAGYGLYANASATNNVASNPSWKEFRVGDPSGAEYVLVSGISGSTATAVQRGWSGTHPVPHTSGETVSFASAGTLTMGTAYEGQIGPLDRREVNIGAWRALYPPQAGEGDSGAGTLGPVTRRAVYLAAWYWCTAAHMTIFRSELQQSVAVSGMWSDSQATSATYVASSIVAPYGRRLWVGYTSVDTTDGWPTGQLAAVIYAAYNRGFTIWGQNASGLANGQDVVTAFEDVAFYTPGALAVMETAESRLTAVETTTATYRGWTGGAGRTMKQYLLTDAGSLNTRLRANLADNLPIALLNKQPLDADLTALSSLFSSGTGSPEGVVTAPVGSFYLRSDGGVGTTFYVKETGATTSTGWSAK